MNTPISSIVRTGEFASALSEFGSNFAGTGEQNLTPTQRVCAELQGSYTYYNRCLFESQLPECMLNVEVTRRSYLGYFRPNSFTNIAGERVHQICINPAYIHADSAKDVLSTLVHEMCHLQVFEADPNKKVTGYHCKTWVACMEAVGLVPSNTGEPGGKKTGYRMSDYILEGGLFDRATDYLLDQEFRLSWGSAVPRKVSVKPSNTNSDDTATPIPNKGKVKLSCPENDCDTRVWGKASSHVLCGDHKIKLIAEGL